MSLRIQKNPALTPNTSFSFSDYIVEVNRPHIPTNSQEKINLYILPEKVLTQLKKKFK